MRGLPISAAGRPSEETHEGLALSVRQFAEESNHLIEIGGHPNWSGIWSGVFLDCSISRGFCKNSTPRGGTATPVHLAIRGVRRCFCLR